MINNLKEFNDFIDCISEIYRNGKPTNGINI